MENTLRIKIIKTAGDLFQKYGTKSVSMDDICGQLSISKKTIYQEVKDKKELINYVVTSRHEEAIDHFSVLLKEEDNPILVTLKMAKFVVDNMLRTSITMVYDLKKYHPDCFQSIKDFKHQFIQEKVWSNMERGKKLKIFRSDVNADIIASFYLSLYDEVINPAYPNTNEYSIETRFTQMLNYHLNGICTEKGRIELNKIQNNKELWPL